MIASRFSFDELERIDDPKVIFRGIVGSHAYGTANENSDVDTRGIFIVPSCEYARLSLPPKQVSDAKNDHTYFSLLRFCELMAESNPTTMEMLYLPTDCILKTTAAFEHLASRRGLFITQRAVESHVGYAVSQMKKAKGCNKRVWNPWPEEPPSPEDYSVFISDARKHPKPLKASDVDLANCKAAPLSKGVTSDMLAVYDFGEPTGGVFRGGKPVLFDIPKSDAERRIGILIFNKQAFESAKRQHQEYWNWRRNRNESRWVQQERGELDYDAKNMMHLTRLLFSGENIVKYGEPIVRFSGDKLKTLLSIRRGEWSFEKIMDHARTIQAEIEAGKDSLPVECDRRKVDVLIAETMGRAGVL